MNPSELPPSLPEGASITPTPSNLQAMNQSAASTSSPVDSGVVNCPKKVSWFAIRVVDEKNAVIEGVTLKLKVTGLGEVERVTSTGVDPIKIEQLLPGGKGDVLSLEAGDIVWQAVGDFT